LCGALRGHESCALQRQRLAESTRVLLSAAAAPSCEHWGARRSSGVQERLPPLLYPEPDIYIWFLWYQRGRRPLINHNRGGCSGKVGVQHSAFEKPLSFC